MNIASVDRNKNGNGNCNANNCSQTTPCIHARNSIRALPWPSNGKQDPPTYVFLFHPFTILVWHLICVSRARLYLPVQSCLPHHCLTLLAHSCLRLPRIPPPAASPTLIPTLPATTFEPQLQFEYIGGVVVCFFVSFTSHLWCLRPCPLFVSFAIHP